MDLYGFVWIYIDFAWTYMDLYRFVWIYVYFAWTYMDFFRPMLIHMCFNVSLCVYMCFRFVYELGVCAPSRIAAACVARTDDGVRRAERTINHGKKNAKEVPTNLPMVTIKDIDERNNKLLKYKMSFANTQHTLNKLKQNLTLSLKTADDHKREMETLIPEGQALK